MSCLCRICEHPPHLIINEKYDEMNYAHSLLRIFKTSGLVLTLGVSLTACSETTWKEEVLLHDGSKIVVTRSQIREGRHEIGQGAPIKEHSITFIPTESTKPITWKDDFSADVGHASLALLAVEITNGTPYIVTKPTNCAAYNKWSRPNPPYVFFKYVDSQWKQISLTEFPAEITKPNVVISTYGHGDVDRAIKSGFVSAANVEELNSGYKQAELKTILRTPMSNEWCRQPTSFKAPIPIPPWENLNAPN